MPAGARETARPLVSRAAVRLPGGAPKRAYGVRARLCPVSKGTAGEGAQVPPYLPPLGRVMRRRQVEVTEEDGTWTGVGADVTATVRARVVAGVLRLPLPLAKVLGDPCFGVAKVLQCARARGGETEILTRDALPQR